AGFTYQTECFAFIDIERYAIDRTNRANLTLYDEAGRNREVLLQVTDLKDDLAAICAVLALFLYRINHSGPTPGSSFFPALQHRADRTTRRPGGRDGRHRRVSAVAFLPYSAACDTGYAAQTERPSVGSACRVVNPRSGRGAARSS